MKDNKIIVWGTGADAKKFLKVVGAEEISYFADNNDKLWGKEFFGKRILSPEEVLNLHDKYLIVISTLKYEEEIEKQLIKNGIDFYTTAKKYKVDRIFRCSQRKNHRIVLLNTHDNMNVGDYLITVAELYFFRKYMSDYELFEVPSALCRDELDRIAQYVRPNDLLVITGGGFLGSLWLEGGETNVRQIVRRFPDNKIVIFPQTMFFEANKEGKRQREISKCVYDSHKNLTFCFRDELSYKLGIKLFDAHVTKKYVPDIVTLLDRSDEIFVRDGILMCMRKDKEQALSEEKVKEIEENLKEHHFAIRKMSMFIEEATGEDNRMDVINSKLYQVQTSRLVFTDRLHCMLLCAISGTPCVAFDSLSAKLSGVYPWIKENSYIYLADDTANIYGKINQLLNMPYKSYKNDNVEKEFRKLAEFLIAKAV